MVNMSKSMFNAPHFQSPEAARAYLEALRWGAERVCPHCGTVNASFATKKPGVYRCGSKGCRKDFSVTTKSVMESSHIKLNVWLQAFFLMSSSKKGMSSHQLHRALGITYKSAWFLTHRIREAIRTGGLLPPMGGAGKTVEADETFIGKNAFSPKGRKKPGVAFRNIVLTLVERGGSARSFPIDTHTLTEITEIVRANVHHETAINTDEGKRYNELGEHFASHDTVNHSKDEYVRGDITTNTVEGYYSICSSVA
jgi:transposase-like protein